MLGYSGILTAQLISKEYNANGKWLWWHANLESPSVLIPAIDRVALSHILVCCCGDGCNTKLGITRMWHFTASFIDLKILTGALAWRGNYILPSITDNDSRECCLRYSTCFLYERQLLIWQTTSKSKPVYYMPVIDMVAQIPELACRRYEGCNTRKGIGKMWHFMASFYSFSNSHGSLT